MTAADERRRVAVTGAGMVSSVGTDVASTWQGLMEGRSGVAPLTLVDASECKVDFGAEADSEQVRERLRQLKLRPADRAVDLAMLAGHEALSDAGLIDEPPYEPQDVAVVVGTGCGSAQSHWEGHEALFEKGVRGLRPTLVPRCMYNALSSGLSLQYKLTGANFVVVSACTSATNAIGQAMRWIRHGYADVVLTGGVDAFFNPFYYSVWNNLGVQSRNEDPRAACRPFDRDRDGTVLGEGAGLLVLESMEHARSRGARIRGEVLGYGESSDAKHRTAPDVEGQVKAMRRALADAQVDGGELGLINAHGTATPANDVCESQSIREVLGDAADRVPVSANKSYFGHTLGASGGLETIVSLLCLEHGKVPANLNLDNPDPECPVALVGDEPLVLESPLVMKNSFGFGGGNGVLVLGRG